MIVAVVLALDWSSWRTILIGITLFSLVLTTLDWTVAYAGILLALVLVPYP